MSGYWQCALVCEGRSDEPLAETLQSLMLACRPGDDIAVEVYRPRRLRIVVSPRNWRPLPLTMYTISSSCIVMRTAPGGRLARRRSVQPGRSARCR